MKKKYPSFLFEHCVCCGICIQACPVSCIQLSKKGIDKYNKLYPELDEEACSGCSLCVKSCPIEAVTMVAIND